MKPRRSSTKRKSSVLDTSNTAEGQEALTDIDSRHEEPPAKRHNRSSESQVLVKKEPRVEMELTSNEYYQLDPLTVKADTELCKCPPVGKGEAGCGQECENRARRVECGGECQAGDVCTNRALQTAGPPPLAFSEGSLVVTSSTQPGDLLAQYTGQVMTKQTFQARLTEEYIKEQDLSLHVFPLSEELVVDATSKGSICRFADHSCAPSGEMTAWKVAGLQCLAVTASREMQAGEKLTLDLSPAMKFLCTSKRCSCDSTNCKKLLGQTAITRGPEKCGACLVKLLDSGKVGEVVLHPSLATPVCQSCSELHQQQDWTSQPGLLCSWCCQQGKLLTCSSCPGSFCRKCLQQNLGTNYIKLAETGSWTCLLCDTKPLQGIKEVLWLPGEEEKARPPVGSRIFSPRTPAAAGRSPRPAQLRVSGRGSPAGRSPAPRGGSPVMARPPVLRGPGTPAVRGIRPVRGGRPLVRPRMPAGAAGRGAPVPVRMLGKTSVSIERVPRPQHRPETAAIISQLQRYSGLSIAPVSESKSSVEAACSQLEAVQRIIQGATSQSRKLLSSDLSGAKGGLAEAVKSCRAKLAEIESLL